MIVGGDEFVWFSASSLSLLPFRVVWVSAHFGLRRGRSTHSGRSNRCRWRAVDRAWRCGVVVQRADDDGASPRNRHLHSAAEEHAVVRRGASGTPSRRLGLLQPRRQSVRHRWHRAAWRRVFGFDRRYADCVKARLRRPAHAAKAQDRESIRQSPRYFTPRQLEALSAGRSHQDKSAGLSSAAANDAASERS